MADYSIIKSLIEQVVKTNGEQEITGANLQNVLVSMINAVDSSNNEDFDRINGSILNLLNYVDAENEDIRNEMQELANRLDTNRYGYNVTVFGLVAGVHTLATAVKNVPSAERFGGQKITFRTDAGWVTYQNTSLSTDNYENVNNWVLDSGVNVEGDVTITNNPDYEDLTQNNQNELKFADKEYSAATFSGLGRTYLRKNIVNGQNVLTSAMLADTNTIYIIQYDYTLTSNISIPADCVLKFEGGSISGNKTITGNNTRIEAGFDKIFGSDVIIDGVWNIVEAYPEWFGAVGDGVAIDTTPIQKCVNSFKTILFSNTYKTRPVILRGNRSITLKDGNTSIISTDDYDDYENHPSGWIPPTGWTPDCIFELMEVDNVIIQGNSGKLSMNGYYNTGESRHCIRMNSCNNIFINDLICERAGGDGICLAWPINGNNQNIHITGCVCDANKRNAISVVDGENVYIENCILKNTISNAPGAGIDIESNYTEEISYQIKGIFITNCKTENNYVGIKITPQYVNNDISITINDFISNNDATGLSFNRLGNGGYVEDKIKGIVTVSNVIITNSKKPALTFNNMVMSDVEINIDNIFIDNPCTTATSSSSNREKCVIGGRVEDETFQYNLAIGGFNIKDLFMRSNNPLLFSTIYIENASNIDTLKNISIEGKFNGFSGLNAEPIVFTGISNFENVNFDILNTTEYSDTPTSPLIISNSQRFYFSEINIGRRNVTLTTSLNDEQVYTFVNTDGIGSLFFTNTNGLLYNNAKVTAVKNVANAIGSKISVIYRNGYWFVVSMTGNWIFNTLVSSGSPSERPTTTKIGLEYFDTGLLKPIWWSGSAWVDATGATV